MSNHPLPIHMSCYGVSTDLVSAIRTQQTGWGPKNYAGMMAFTQAMHRSNMQAQSAAPSANILSTLQASSSMDQALVSHHQPTPARAMQPPKLIPLASDTYQSIMADSLARMPVPLDKAMTSSVAFEKSSKLNASMPQGVWTDFSAIADSSVGGGGLPRPYGRFNAGRGGDGNALWERLPRQNGIKKLKKRGEELSASVNLEQRSNSAHVACSSHSQSPSRYSPTRRRVRSGSWVPTFRSEKLAIVRGEQAETLGAEYASSLRRPDVAKNNSSTVVAATFLTEPGLPRLPEYVRVDCGSTAAVEHLASGETVQIKVSPPRDTRLTTKSATPVLVPASATEAMAGAGAQLLQGSASLPARETVFGGEENALSALMKEDSRGRTQSPVWAFAHASGGNLPGGSLHRGQYTGQNSGNPSTTAPPFPTTGRGKRVGMLPAENSLPRRFVPPGR